MTDWHCDTSYICWNPPFIHYWRYLYTCVFLFRWQSRQRIVAWLPVCQSLSHKAFVHLWHTTLAQKLKSLRFIHSFDLWKRKLRLDVETKLFCYSDIFGKCKPYWFLYTYHNNTRHNTNTTFFFNFYEVILETMHFQTNSPYYSTATNRHMSHISHLNNVVAAHC